VKLSLVQTNVEFGNFESNLQRTLAAIEQEPSDLIVFPECALTGYVCHTQQEAEQIARESSELGPIDLLCRKLGKYAIVGYARKFGAQIFNTADFYGPDGLLYRYSKTHLLCLGIDRFTSPGDELGVVSAPFGNIGILICYDQRPPEAARTLALRGADLIVLPTNWPKGAEISSNYISRARAAENHVFYACCNRVGIERGTEFIGESKVIGPTGALLEEADANESVIRAELDLVQARAKHVINIPGEYEFDVFGDRRPELYELT
jgi:predicted amidohydrolase